MVREAEDLVTPDEYREELELRDYFEKIQPDRVYKDGVVGPSQADFERFGFDAAEITPGWFSLNRVVNTLSKFRLLKFTGAVGAAALSAFSVMPDYYSEASTEQVMYPDYFSLPANILDLSANLSPDLSRVLAQGNVITRIDPTTGQELRWTEIKKVGEKVTKPYQLFAQNYPTLEASISGSLSMVDAYLNTRVIKDYTSGYAFYLRHNVGDLKCNQLAQCDPPNFTLFRNEVERGLAAGFLVPETAVIIKSNTHLTAGWAVDVDRKTMLPDATKAPSPYYYVGLVWPDEPSEIGKTVPPEEQAHRWNMDHQPPGSPGDKISIMGRGTDWTLEEEAYIREMLSLNEGNYNARYQTPRFKILNSIISGYSLSSITQYFGISIPVEIPLAATQYRLGVYPPTNPFTGQPDGPAIELIIGDSQAIAEVYQNKRIFLPAPKMGEGPYIFLPGKYRYVLCVSAEPTSLSWNPIQNWEKPIKIWPGPDGLTITNKCQSGEFDTRDAQRPSSTTIRPLGFNQGSLRWENSDPTIFYYEVQVSGDDRFDNNPDTATSFVWWNLVHGGVTNPLNSWKTPSLEPNKTYFWRVRPRVQGDGTPVTWSQTWKFKTP